MTFEQWWAKEERMAKPTTANGVLFDQSIALKAFAERAWEEAYRQGRDDERELGKVDDDV